jgi:hypothetical protein
MAGKTREGALFNLATNSKLRVRDLVGQLEELRCENS